jgi:hypothetical protein
MKEAPNHAGRETAPQADATPAPAEAPWYIPKKPANPAQTAQVHVLAHATPPRTVRVCYLKGGPEGSFVAVRANTDGGTNVATNIYLGACVDIGGSDVEITNHNDVPVSGTYLLLPKE